MEVISSDHMNVEKEIFDPHSQVSRSIILFDVHGFKPLRELMLHDLICRTHRMGRSLDPSNSLSDACRCPCPEVVPSRVTLVHMNPCLISGLSSRRAVL